MKLANTDGIEETIIDEQVKNYFFREGYLRKSDTEYKNVLDKFKKDNPKLMNDARLNLAKESYKLGVSHEFL
jgi:hypothetical protein